MIFLFFFQKDVNVLTKNLGTFPLHLLQGLTSFPNKIGVINRNCHTRYD